MDLGVVTAQLLHSFGLNCMIFFVTLVLAIPLGLVVAFGSMNRFEPLSGLSRFGVPDWLCRFRPIAWLTRTFVWIIRGTPLMLQLLVVFFVPGLVWGWEAMPRPTAAVVAFVINYAAYFSEIYRGGISGIPKGQQEAGQVLGMTRAQIFFKVTLLQVVKRIVPPMGNEIITLVKDTALANYIANKEIIMMAKEYITKGIWWPLFYSAVFFLIFVGALTLLLNYTEKRLDYFKA